VNPVAAAAFGFRAHSILGYRLEPLSAAHAAALEASGVNVFTDALDPRDLVTFLRICSRPIDPKTMRPKGWPNEVNGWREIAALAWLAIRGNLVSVTKQVQAYLADNLSSPTVRLPVGTEASQPQGDGFFARVTIAMKAGIPEFRAWSMSLGMLDWVLAHHALNEGARIRIVDPVAESARIALLRQLAAKNTQPKTAANG
jgi:hypothetical protein